MTAKAQQLLVSWLVELGQNRPGSAGAFAHLADSELAAQHQNGEKKIVQSIWIWRDENWAAWDSLIHNVFHYVKTGQAPTRWTDDK